MTSAMPNGLGIEPPRRVAVFRALMLGDLLCAVPALRALKAAWPACELTLIGLPWARELAGRLVQVDRFIAFPGYPGLPETEPNLLALPAFLRQVQEQRFDLLLQLHGSGVVVNPLVAAFGARHVAGFAAPGTYCAEPALSIAWPEAGHEIERLLQVTDHLGVPRRGLRLEFPVHDEDRRVLARLWPGIDDDGGAYVCVHAGAQLASRRWPLQRFAAVADHLAQCGCRVLLTGSAGEARLVAELQAAMRHRAVNLAGQTNLGVLGALIERARLLVCNDTGVSHIAAALGTPSVVVSCGADVARWAPLDRERHVGLWEPMACRPCAHAQCPVGHGCARAIEASRVAALAEQMTWTSTSTC